MNKNVFVCITMYDDCSVTKCSKTLIPFETYFDVNAMDRIRIYVCYKVYMLSFRILRTFFSCSVHVYVRKCVWAFIVHICIVLQQKAFRFGACFSSLCV